MKKAFRFVLVVDGASFEVDPLGVDGVKLKSEREGENIFFRRKLGGTLKFIKADFSLLYALETSENRCGDIKLSIERLCGGLYRPEWEGTLSLNEVKWNVSRCEAEVQVRPNDAYRCIIDNYSKEYNILEVPTTSAVAASVPLAHEFEFITVDKDDADFQDRTDVNTWAVFLEIRNWQNGTTLSGGKRASDNVMFRQVQNKPYIGGVAQDFSADGWEVIIDDPLNQSAIYGRQPAIPGFTSFLYEQDGDFYGKYPNLLQWNCGDMPDLTKYIVVNPFNINCIDIRKNRYEVRSVTLIWEFGTFYFSRNRNFLDSLRFLVEKTCSSLAPQNSSALSNFFTTPTNYATGSANKLRDLHIAQKTDITNYKSSEAATKGMVSLKKMLDDLRSMFDVYWFINASGKFQIEHISYFTSFGVVDFTVPQYERNLAGKFAYEYESSKMPRFEKLTFAEADGDDFKEGVIEYSGACVSYDEGSDTKEKNVTEFTTDLDLLVVNGENVNKKGLVLIAQSNGQVDYEIGDLTGRMLINGHLSAANLLKNYHTHSRILINGTRNGKAAVFSSVLKTKKQVAFSVDNCCELELNPFFQYITNVSENGSLASSELSLKTGSATVEILHETSGSGFAVSSRQFDDSFDDSFR